MQDGLNRNFVFVLVGLVVGVGAIVAAVALPKMVSPPAAPSAFPTPQAAPTLDEGHRNSQQQDQFVMSTIKPTTAAPSLCNDRSVNREPEILVGYSPASGETVGKDGQIKVWVNDEGAPHIAPGEQVSVDTGQITTPGDRTAKAPDGYLWEPALYIAPQTAETGGTPHFPTLIKGSYNNDPPSRGAGTSGPPIDPYPAGTTRGEMPYEAEFIWDVNSLGLSAGTYQAEFMIRDGDAERGVGCVSITIN